MFPQQFNINLYLSERTTIRLYHKVIGFETVEPTSILSNSLPTDPYRVTNSSTKNPFNFEGASNELQVIFHLSNYIGKQARKQ